MAKEEEIIRQCSWCKAVWDDDAKEWVAFPDVIPGASHGMCPPCEAKFLADWAAKRKKNPMAKRDPLMGAVIINVRPATAAEKSEMMWPRAHDFMVIELSTGAQIFASSDDEFNAPGSLHYNFEGKTYTLVKRR
jgi:hypothetical protein